MTDPGKPIISLVLDAKLIAMHTYKLIFKGIERGERSAEYVQEWSVRVPAGSRTDKSLNKPQCCYIKNSAAAFVFFVEPDTFHAMSSKRAEIANSSNGHNSTVFYVLNLASFFEHPYSR